MNQKSITDAYAAGRVRRSSFAKIPTQTTASGIWFDLSLSPGNPAPQYYFATPYAFQPMARSTDGGLDHGQPVGPEGFKKILHKFNLQTPTATAAPLSWCLLDYLGFYPGLAMDVGFLPMVNVNPVPRYTGRDGIQMMVVEQNPYVGGAQFQISYEDDQGTPRVTSTLVCNTQVSTGTIATSAPATNLASGRFVALPPGVRGVNRVTGIEFLTPDVGLLAIALVRPITEGMIWETTAPCYMELDMHRAEYPLIADDAYLNLIAMPVGTLAAASLTGDLTAIWTPTES